MRGVAPQRRRQRVGRRRREFRRRRVDDRVDDLEAAEGVFERQAALPPGQILRQQRVNVGVQREMGGGVNAAGNSEQDAKNDDATGKTQTEVYDPADDFRQHGVNVAPRRNWKA